jgi:hypothetical protein
MGSNCKLGFVPKTRWIGRLSQKAAASCAGLLKVGAGFMLAIGFSFAAYSAYSRFGNSNIFCCLSSDSLFIDNCS